MQKINELQLAKELIRFPTVTPVDAGVMKFLEKKLKKIGFSSIKMIKPTEKTNLFNLSFEATAGAPVPQIENGYIVKDDQDNGFYIEPHGYLDENLKKSIHESTYELWNFCKKQLLSGENDQIILDEIFLAVEMKIIDKDDLISTLENRFISGDVILTGTDIPKDLLLMANQITELRS